MYMRTSPATAKHLKWLVGWLATVLTAVAVVVAVVATGKLAWRLVRRLARRVCGQRETLQISRGSSLKKPVMKNAKKSPAKTPAKKPAAVMKRAPMKPKVFGGVAASTDRYPYYCFFTKPNETWVVCGGALIAPDRVLSAAHCGIQAGDSVYIGGPIGGPQTDHRIVKMAVKAVHAGLDLAVIQLTTPSTKQPIKLARQNPPNDSPVVVLGRGRKQNAETERNNDFTVAQLTYIDRNMAANLMGKEEGRAYAGHIGNLGIISAHSPDKGTCFGDSGGPLIIDRGAANKDELLGISSYVMTKDGKNYCDAAQTKRKWSFFVSIPRYLHTQQDVLKTVRKMQQEKCRFTDLDFPDCPSTHPWDTGIVTTSHPFKCTTTQSCAQLQNQMFIYAGEKVVTPRLK